jgi:5'-nucleotidase
VLTLLHTSDLHSRVWPFWERISSIEARLGLGRAGALEQVGGFARLATVLERERSAGTALWLDSGDVLEGAEVFRRLRGRVELELLGALGLSAMALGNHELALSGPELAEWLSASAFPVLAANLRPRADSTVRPRLSASALVEAGGFKVGLVGVANPHSPPDLASAGNAWRLDLLEELAAATQGAIDEVAPRADLVVLLSHLGLDADRELVPAISGVDLVLGGHQHVVTEAPEWLNDCSVGAVRDRGCASRPVPIVHSGAYGKLVSRLELSLARAPSGRWELAGVALAQLPLSSGVPLHPDVLEWLERVGGPPERVLGFAPRPLRRRSALGGDSALGNLVADAMRSAVGSDVVVLNSSALRGDVEAGVLLESDLELVFPFGEPWLTARVSGARLKQGLLRAAGRSAERGCDSTLQVSGLKLRVDCSACRASGAGCVEARLVGPWGETPLGDAELVLVSLPAYLTQSGADFEGLGELGSQQPLGVVEVLVGEVSRWANGMKGHACLKALLDLAPARCTQVFGVLGCPVSAARAASFCGHWPWIIGGTDGRIEMRP